MVISTMTNATSPRTDRVITCVAIASRYALRIIVELNFYSKFSMNIVPRIRLRMFGMSRERKIA